MPQAIHHWTRKETLAALHLYFQLPFGQLHRNQPKIKALSALTGRTPSSIALKLVNFASLDPQVVASGRKGMGNVSLLDKEIWMELAVNWDAVALEAAADFEGFAISNNHPPEIDVVEELGFFEEGRTRIANVAIRVNQARFRRSILASYNATCCISGLRDERLVIASHIVPWSDDKRNRLNPQNGLCLSALHDRAFDQGLLAVMPDYTIRISPRLKQAPSDPFLTRTLLAYDGRSIQMPDRLRPSPEFLAIHAKRFGFAV